VSSSLKPLKKAKPSRFFFLLDVTENDEALTSGPNNVTVKLQPKREHTNIAELQQLLLFLPVTR
jgi:hypothetical protein